MYNGWSDHLTWLTELHMDNEFYTHERMREFINEYAANNKKDVAVYKTSESLRKFVEDCLYETFEQTGMDKTGIYQYLTDIVNSALSDINWHEIAEGLYEEWEEDHKDEES